MERFIERLMVRLGGLLLVAAAVGGGFLGEYLHTGPVSRLVDASGFVYLVSSICFLFSISLMINGDRGEKLPPRTQVWISPAGQYGPFPGSSEVPNPFQDPSEAGIQQDTTAEDREI